MIRPSKCQKAISELFLENMAQAVTMNRALIGLRTFLGAFALVAAFTFNFSPAFAADSNDDGQIILAALNRTTPSDRISATANLFGAHENRYGDIRAFTKWTGVLNRFKDDFASSMDRPEVKDWMKFISSLKNASREKKLEAVNDYMNSRPFSSDEDNYGVSDYWATPMEFLARGKGDCEDYAVAKYITLRALGFAMNEMRLAIVYDRVMQMPHALLIVYDEDQAKVLDSQNPEIMDSADISRYKPIYSISQLAWWRH